MHMTVVVYFDDVQSLDWTLVDLIKSFVNSLPGMNSDRLSVG